MTTSQHITDAEVVTAALTVMRGFRYVAGRGTVGCGYYVTDRDGRVVAGPFTNLTDAWREHDKLSERAA